MADLVGATLGQYDIIELQGEGGMATVYKAWQSALQRYVALKVLAPNLSGEADFVARFQQEAVAAANLNHNNIVTIYDVGSEQGYFYIAMEFIDGTSLKERIAAEGPLALERVVDIITQVGGALDYAHQRGFFHRDIKPANVLIEQTGRVVLTDFGIVEAMDSGDVISTSTEEGSIFGTPHYMSPEQIRGEPLDSRSDLYSLGVVCYEMLSGGVPFDGSTRSILYAHTHTPPPPLREVTGAGVSSPMEAVVNKTLAKRPTDRFSSVGQFVTALSQAAVGLWPEDVHAGIAVPEQVGGSTDARKTRHREKTRQPQSAPARRSRWALFLGVVALGVALIVGAVLLPGEGDALVEMLYEAQAALDDADYRKAADEFGRVLADDPNNLEAINGQLEAAAKLAQAGQWDVSIGAYALVGRVRPQETGALQGLAQVYEAKGDLERAANWYEKWAQVAPEEERAWLGLGRTGFNLLEYEVAVAAYERARTLGAVDSQAERHLGLAYYELAQYGRAVERLEGVLNEGVDDFQLRRVLGLSLYRMGQSESATEHLKEASVFGTVRSGEELADVYYALGNSFFEQRDYQKAIGYYEQALQLDPGGRANFAEGARARLEQARRENVLKDALLDLDFSTILAEGDQIYAIARTEQKVRIEGAVHLVEGPEEGLQALVVEQGTTNALRNPGVEFDLTNWQTFTSSGWSGTQRLVRSTVDSRFGTACARWRVDATNNPGNAGVLVDGMASVPASAGAVWTGSVWLKIISNPDFKPITFKIAARDSDRNILNTWSTSIESSPNWSRMVITTGPLPEDTSSIELMMRVDGFVIGETIDLLIDGAQLEQKPSVTSYSDGDQGPGYRWNDGERPHQSNNTREKTTINLDGYVGLISGKSRLSFRIVARMPYDADGTWPRDGQMYLMDGYGGNDANQIRFIYDAAVDRFSLALNNWQTVESLLQTFSAGDWMEFVFTLDYGSDEYRLYIDGEPAGFLSYSTDAPTLTAWRLGTSVADYHPNITLFGISVLEGVLTHAEVAALHGKDMFSRSQD